MTYRYPESAAFKYCNFRKLWSTLLIISERGRSFGWQTLFAEECFFFRANLSIFNKVSCGRWIPLNLAICRHVWMKSSPRLFKLDHDNDSGANLAAFNNFSSSDTFVLEYRVHTEFTSREGGRKHKMPQWIFVYESNFVEDIPLTWSPASQTYTYIPQTLPKFLTDSAGSIRIPSWGWRMHCSLSGINGVRWPFDYTFCDNHHRKHHIAVFDQQNHISRRSATYSARSNISLSFKNGRPSCVCRVMHSACFSFSARLLVSFLK